MSINSKLFRELEQKAVMKHNEPARFLSLLMSSPGFLSNDCPCVAFPVVWGYDFDDAPGVGLCPPPASRWLASEALVWPRPTAGLAVFKHALTLLCLVALGTGCTAPPLAPQAFTSAGTGRRQVNQGFSIEAEVVRSPGVLKQTFGTDNLGKNIVAVHLIASNSTDRAFLVRPTDFHLASKTSTSSGRDSAGGKTMADVGAGAFMAGVVVAPPAAIAVSPFMFWGLSMQSNASVVKQNLLQREFKATTLTKGEAAEGFLYFRISEQPGLNTELLEASIAESDASTPPITFQLDVGH